MKKQKKIVRLLKLLKLTLLMLIINPLRWCRIKMIRGLLKLRSKLRKQSLREAIVKADQMNNKTGRKTMVVFNNYSGKYEPLEKKLLKNISAKNKYSSSKTSRRGKKKPRVLNSQRINQIENRSLYVAAKRKAS